MGPRLFTEWRRGPCRNRRLAFLFVMATLAAIVIAALGVPR